MLSLMAFILHALKDLTHHQGDLELTAPPQTNSGGGLEYDKVPEEAEYVDR